MDTQPVGVVPPVAETMQQKDIEKMSTAQGQAVDPTEMCGACRAYLACPTPPEAALQGWCRLFPAVPLRNLNGGVENYLPVMKFGAWCAQFKRGQGPTYLGDMFVLPPEQAPQTPEVPPVV